MKKQRLSIGEVARAAGISTSAIRYYEGMGLLPTTERVSGRRVYDQTIFAPLAAIQLAQESGFTVAEIKQLLDSCTTPGAQVSQGWKKLAAAKVQELDRTVAKATAMKDLLQQWLECECVSLEDCQLISTRLLKPAPPG